MTNPACRRCDGRGLIADSDDGEPWTAWENLPPGADLAVKVGLVRPIPCPDCTAINYSDDDPGDAPALPRQAPAITAPAAHQLAAVRASRDIWRARMAEFAEHGDSIDEAVLLIADGAALIVDALNVLAAAHLEAADRAWHPGKPLPTPGVPR